MAPYKLSKKESVRNPAKLWDINLTTHPQENRHCTIALVPSLGPNTALKGLFQKDASEEVYIFTGAKLTNRLGPCMFYKKKSVSQPDSNERNHCTRPYHPRKMNGPFDKNKELT
jgi:hypothetical protein